MFTSMTRKIATMTAVSLVAAGLSLSTISAANAAGFSFSIGGGDIAIGVMGGGDRAPGAQGDQRSIDERFDRLDARDAQLHEFVDGNGGFNVLLQQKHDCIVVEKIKTLLAQMDGTLRGYQRIHDQTGITYQENLIKDWEGRLREAEKECNKAWF